MNMLSKILEQYPDEPFLFADGFDDAVIGFEENTGRLIYSVEKCLEILRKNMSHEDAVEHFLYNVHGSYVGEKTPIWCHDCLQ